MEKFFINVISGVFADERVQLALAKLLKDQVEPLIPLAAAAAAKALEDAVTKKFSKILDADPDIPGISDVFDLSETIRGMMNEHPEVNIPIIGGFLKGLTGG